MLSQEYVRILKYILVGIWNTFFDLSIFTVFLNTFGNLKIWKKTHLKPATISNMVAFLIANSVSYIINSKFTFSDSSSNRGWLPYLIISMFSLGLSTLIIQVLSVESLRLKINLFIRDLHPIFQAGVGMKKYIFLIKISTVIITMVVNYFGYKILVF